VLIFIAKLFSKNVLNFFRRKIDYFDVRDNSVLIMEFYYVHGESMPGYIKYLLDLNFNVDVVLCKKGNKSIKNDPGLFLCFSQNEKVRLKSLSDFDMNFLLRSKIANKYKHIIINSFSNGMERNHLYNVNLFKLKPVCVAHNPNNKNKYFKTDKIISLVEINSTNRKPTIPVNSHYFGEFEKREISKTTVFTALNEKDTNRRNTYLLFDACDKLYEKGINNFHVKIMGKGISIPERYRNNIQDFGFVVYQELFKEINDSDFFLAQLKKKSVQYTNKASGSHQISYGFLKPIVLHNIFANVSGFNNSNSILYNSNNELADAMEKCINMSNNDYLSLKTALEISEKNLYNVSLENLKRVLEIQDTSL
jgi:hypothetical protein